MSIEDRVFHEFAVDSVGSVIFCGIDGCPHVALDVPALQSHREHTHGLDLGPSGFRPMIESFDAMRAFARSVNDEVARR